MKTELFLGTDQEGNKVYLEPASRDCGWYRGFGYVETYTKGGTFDSHQHFDNLFLHKNIWDSFKEYFKESPFIKQAIDHKIEKLRDGAKESEYTYTEKAELKKEWWKLLELMKQFYILREMAEMWHRWWAHITTVEVPYKEDIKQMSDKINKEILPALFKEIENLFTSLK